MADLGKAYVQIIPKAEGISGKIGNLITPGAKDAGKKAGVEGGNGLADGIKSTLAKLAIGATIGAGIKAAMDEGGKLQQSFGGIDTLYGNVTESAKAAGMSVKEYTEIHGNAADKMKQFAMEASKVGISANDYAEQAVSFGASLKQAFGGDATKAAEAANVAIMDMTDNAAKMGTPIENIQNAYQGFAKQNYTMLDNLKLGYGGTKSEMERLLADATKLTGVEYDIDNLGDVYAAIHAIQGDLGLTGVAAAEASETFSGSFGAMQAAAANLLGALTTGGDVAAAMETLVGSAITFVGGNLIPMLGTMFSAIPTALGTAISTAVPMIQEKIPEIIAAVQSLFTDIAPNLIQAGVTLLTEVIPGLFSKVNGMILTYVPILLQAGVNIIRNIISGITQNLPLIIAQAQSMIGTFLSTITALLPVILENGKNLVFSIVDGIIANIPTLLEGAGNMIVQFAEFIQANIPTIAEKGAEILKGLATKIISAIPIVIEAVVKLIPKIVVALAKLVPAAIKAAFDMLKGLAQGIRDGISNVTPAVKNLIEKIKKPIEDLKGKLKTIMDNVMTTLVGVWDKIKSKAQSVWEGIKKAITDPIDKAKSLVEGAVNKIKGIFPISMGKIFSGIKLPHFKISGGTPPWGIGGAGTKPTVGIEWYKRGGIATNPTIYGIGEAGNEAIVPLSNPYMTPFAKAIAAEMPSAGNTFNIQIDGARDPSAVVDELLRRVNLKARTV